jgi:hypothetical protein
MTLHYRWNYVWIAVAMLIKAIHSVWISKTAISKMNDDRNQVSSMGKIVGIVAKLLGIIVLGFFLYHWQNPDIHKIGLIVIRIGAVISIIMAAVSIGKVPLPILLGSILLPILYMLSQRSWIFKVVIIPREFLPLIILILSVVTVIGAVIKAVLDHSAWKRQAG